MMPMATPPWISEVVISSGGTGKDVDKGISFEVCVADVFSIGAAVERTNYIYLIFFVCLAENSYYPTFRS